MKNYKDYSDTLIEEAEAFDSQIKQRVSNGHIPDLRNAQDCDYFYNNPWRRKAYIELDFGEQFELINDAIKTFTKQVDRKLKIMEVGCGPGYMSLELARAGHDVTGVDLSEDCIDVASATAKKYAPDLLGTSLNYQCADFFTFESRNEFDVVLFLGALHHFPDQAKVHEKVMGLLNSDGLFICHEPVRDKVTKGNAAFFYLLTSLLKFTGNYYQEEPQLPSGDTLNSRVEDVFNTIRYELEDGEKLQSVNDNEAGYAEMEPFLSDLYNQMDFQWRYAFFHEVIGGLRCESEEKNAELAKFIKEMDGLLCQEKVLSPTEFFFVGRPK